MITPHARRARYLIASECLVESCAVTASQLSVRSMNFGQRWRTQGVQGYHYSATLPVQLFIDVLERELPEFVDDAVQHPDKASDLENALRDLGWPTVSEVIAHPVLAQMWLEYLGHTLLLDWFGDGEPHAQPGFVIHTIQDISRMGDRIRLRGMARQAGLQVAYQDV
jgi:hypothetical protein